MPEVKNQPVPGPGEVELSTEPAVVAPLNPWAAAQQEIRAKKEEIEASETFRNQGKEAVNKAAWLANQEIVYETLSEVVEKDRSKDPFPVVTQLRRFLVGYNELEQSHQQAIQFGFETVPIVPQDQVGTAFDPIVAIRKRIGELVGVRLEEIKKEVVPESLSERGTQLRQERERLVKVNTALSRYTTDQASPARKADLSRIIGETAASYRADRPAAAEETPGTAPSADKQVGQAATTTTEPQQEQPPIVVEAAKESPEDAEIKKLNNKLKRIQTDKKLTPEEKERKAKKIEAELAVWQELKTAKGQLAELKLKSGETATDETKEIEERIKQNEERIVQIEINKKKSELAYLNKLKAGRISGKQMLPADQERLTSVQQELWLLEKKQREANTPLDTPRRAVVARAANDTVEHQNVILENLQMSPDREYLQIRIERLKQMEDSPEVKTELADCLIELHIYNKAIDLLQRSQGNPQVIQRIRTEFVEAISGRNRLALLQAREQELRGEITQNQRDAGLQRQLKRTLTEINYYNQIAQQRKLYDTGRISIDEYRDHRQIILLALEDALKAEWGMIPARPLARAAAAPLIPRLRQAAPVVVDQEQRAFNNDIAQAIESLTDSINQLHQMVANGVAIDQQMLLTQERQLEVYVGTGYSAFLSAERKMTRVAPETLQGFVWYNNLSENWQKIIYGRCLINTGCSIKRGTTMMSLEAFLRESSSGTIGIPNDAIINMMNEMPGLRMMVATMFQELFTIQEVVPPGLNLDRRVPENVANLLSFKEGVLGGIFKDFSKYRRDKLAVLVEYFQRNYQVGADNKFDTGPKTPRVTYEEAASAAFDAAWEWLFLANACESADQGDLSPGTITALRSERNLTPTTLKNNETIGRVLKGAQYGTEQFKALFRPYAKLYEKITKPNQESWLGVLGNWFAERVRHRDSKTGKEFINKFYRRDIRLVPERLFASWFDLVTIDETRTGTASVAETFVNCPKALVDQRLDGLYDFSDRDFFDLKKIKFGPGEGSDTYGGVYMDAMSAAIHIYETLGGKNIFDAKKGIGDWATRLANALTKLRGIPCLAPFVKDPDLIIGCIAGSAGLTEGTNEYLLELPDQVYDSIIRNVLRDDRLFTDMPKGSRDYVRRKLHANDTNTLLGFFAKHLYSPIRPSIGARASSEHESHEKRASK